MIHGYLEMATPNLIQGWAFDDEAPTVRLVVRAHLGDTELGRTVASGTRPDLRGKWGENDGNHGFIIQMVRPSPPQRAAEIMVEVARPGGAVWHLLPSYAKSDALTTDATPGRTESAGSPAITIIGFLDFAATYHFGGWALDEANPTARLIVRARLGDTVLAQSEVSTRRPDLQRRPGDDDAAHGFILRFQTALTQAQIAQATVEAAYPGSMEWFPLPVYFPEPIARESIPSPSPEVDKVSRLLSGNDFWSDDPIRAPVDSDDVFPIFITGSRRSGTSAVREALIRATRFRGFNEGHVFDIADQLIKTIECHAENKYKLLPADTGIRSHHYRYPHRRYRAGVSHLLRRMAAGYTTPFWVDKTPTHEMILSVPTIAETWPNARFIFMRRRGLENVMSRLRRHWETQFEMHCRDWALIMSDWRRVRASIPDRFLELDQRDLLDDPDVAAARLGSLLNLGAGEIWAIGIELRSVDTEVTDPTATIIADIAETGWSAEMIATFRAICGPEMEAYGYTYDEYYRTGVKGLATE